MELRAAIATWHEHVATSRVQTKQSPARMQLNDDRVLLAGNGTFEKTTGWQPIRELSKFSPNFNWITHLIQTLRNNGAGNAEDLFTAFCGCEL